MAEQVKLGAVQQAVNSGTVADPEEVIGIDGSLVVDRTERAPERQYCIFRAGRERYCLAVLDVEEVVDWPSATILPLGPAFMIGIFNLRGSIVPIIDIAVSEGRRADLPPKRVVVARMAARGDRGDLRLGIAADEVIGTFTTREPLLVDEAPRDVPHCSGMLRHDNRLALAIDLEQLIQVFPVPVI
jgi:purine-binding chemotaxis protein CheW